MDEPSSQSAPIGADSTPNMTHSQVLDWARKHPFMTTKPFELTERDWLNARLDFLSAAKDALLFEIDAVRDKEPTLDMDQLRYSIKVKTYRRENRFGGDDKTARYVPCDDTDRATHFRTFVCSSHRPDGPPHPECWTQIRPAGCDKTDSVWDTLVRAHRSYCLVPALTSTSEGAGGGGPSTHASRKEPLETPARLRELAAWWTANVQESAGVGMTLGIWARAGMADDLSSMARGLEIAEMLT